MNCKADPPPILSETCDKCEVDKKYNTIRKQRRELLKSNFRKISRQFSNQEKSLVYSMINQIPFADFEFRDEIEHADSYGILKYKSCRKTTVLINHFTHNTSLSLVITTKK